MKRIFTQKRTARTLTAVATLAGLWLAAGAPIYTGY